MSRGGKLRWSLPDKEVDNLDCSSIGSRSHSVDVADSSIDSVSSAEVRELSRVQPWSPKRWAWKRNIVSEPKLDYLVGDRVLVFAAKHNKKCYYHAGEVSAIVSDGSFAVRYNDPDIIGGESINPRLMKPDREWHEMQNDVDVLLELKRLWRRKLARAKGWKLLKAGCDLREMGDGRHTALAGLTLSKDSTRVVRINLPSRGLTGASTLLQRSRCHVAMLTHRVLYCLLFLLFFVSVFFVYFDSWVQVHFLSALTDYRN
jgi:hypothetical protein